MFEASFAGLGEGGRDARRSSRDNKGTSRWLRHAPRPRLRCRTQPTLPTQLVIQGGDNTTGGLT